MKLIVSIAFGLALPAVAQTVLVKPYVLPGAQSSHTETESMAIVWLTDQRPGNFVVDYAVEDSPSRSVAPQRIQLDFAPAKPRPWPKTAVTSDGPIRVPPPAEGQGQHYYKYTALLTGIPFSSRIRYRVKLGARTIREAAFVTRATSDQSIRFAIVGDLANGRSEQDAVAYQMDRMNPQFLVALGDIVYPEGRVSEYMDHFWTTYNQPAATSPETGAPLMASIPFYVVLGNHDVDRHNLTTIPDALGIYHFFNAPTRGAGEGAWNTPIGKGPDAARFRAAVDESYPGLGVYSFDNGPAHFVILDNSGYVNLENPALREWIDSDLRGSRAQWKFVCVHAPLFHSSREHYTAQKSRLLAPLLQRNDVDLVFAGHVHNYQRSLPLRFTPNPPKRTSKGYVNGEFQLDTKFDGLTNTRPDGIIHVVSGGGGASLYSVDFEKTVEALKRDHPENYVPITARYYASAHSFSVVDLTPTSFQLRQINLNGEEIDRFTITKPAR